MSENNIVLGYAKIISEPSVLKGNNISFQIEWEQEYIYNLEETKKIFRSFKDMCDSSYDVMEMDSNLANQIIDHLGQYKIKFGSKLWLFSIQNFNFFTTPWIEMPFYIYNCLIIIIF